MNIIEQRQIKILWIIFMFVLVPGFLWQLWFQIQQFVFAIFHVPRKQHVNTFFDDRD